MLASPLGFQQGYSDQSCPLGTERVVNTGECATGPGGFVVRNKVGKLMNVDKCATYIGREYDEITAHEQNTAAPDILAAFNTSNDHDFGEIASIVDGGNCVFDDSLGTRIDPICVIQQFYITHLDTYDMVAIWPNFNHAEGSYHNFVKNDVIGINVPIQDNSAAFGTTNLKSFVLLRNFTIMPASPYDRIMQPAPNNDSPMSLMGQETGHRWAAYVRRDKDPGPRIRVANDILGRNLAHWCFYLDGPSSTVSSDPTRPGFSSMEGNRWEEISPGTYRTGLKSDGFSKIDQYLMGFRSPGDVGTFYRLDTGNGKVTPDCSHQPYTASIDTPWTVSYPKINIQVDDITRVEGLREPDSQTSQKNWRMAFILLTRTGVLPTSAEISRLEAYRSAWEGYFRDESGGGRMFTALGPVDMDQDTYSSNVDCDEQNPAINPGATEVCNGADDDCDGLVDDGFDLDGDLWTTCNGDCNDTPGPGAGIYPGAVEIWNGLDDNCDDAIDNVNLIDADGDGSYANPQPPTQADCQDDNNAVYPGAVEIVNGYDDNCNGYVDCADPTVVHQSDSGSRGNDGLDNDCNGIIDG